MKDAERYFHGALNACAPCGAGGDEGSLELCAAAARHCLALLSPPSEGETQNEREERRREARYLSWAAEREADKISRHGCASPERAFIQAIGTRRFLEAFLFIVPLKKLEELLRGVSLPGYAEAAFRNRRIRRSAPKTWFGLGPATAQIYIRNGETVETLRVFSRLTGRAESLVAKEAVSLGARAMAGALGGRIPSDIVADEADEDARIKEEAADRMEKAAETLRRRGWRA